ncbi:HATPase_Hsp90-like domain containing protein [Candidatus Methylopumilus universalis]|uniref:DUF3883 domain-containing protein n=1 Tax=Candidatus Methylopumilus universalis TaxID=2588536 RepID=UPI003BEF0B15
MTPKQIIEKIRTQLKDDYRNPKMVNNLLLYLAEDIYKLDNHYIFELLQNADDNEYRANAIPSIEFNIESSRLIVINNEIGFTEENINSICSAGSSSKKIKKIEGYIGEKGLGFKSIFKITDTPEIYSNGFHFSFKALPEDGELAYVVPYWISNPNKNYINGKTNIVVPAKKGSSFSIDSFSEIKPELLLFLRRLKHITLEEKTNQCSLEISREDSEDLITIRTREKKEGNIEENLEFYKISKFNIDMSNLEIEKRKGFKETSIIFAFPITEQGQAKFDRTRKTFAFLPVHDYGLSFIIQSDFLLTTSREDILENNQWNEQIIKNIPVAFIQSAIPLFKQDKLLSKTFYAYLNPARVEGLFEASINEIVRGLYEENCILSEALQWRKPDDCLFLERLVEPIIKNDELNKLIGKEFVSKEIVKFKIVLEKLGCVAFSIDHMLECLKNKEWVDSHKNDKDWFKNLYTYLFSKITNEDGYARIFELQEKINKLNIFLLKNGEISSCNVLSKKVFMPLSDKLNYSFENELFILDEKTIPDMLDKTRINQFFYDLGVSKADPEDIIENYILQEHQKYKIEGTVIANQILISHANYIKDNVDIIDARLQLKLENSFLLLLRDGKRGSLRDIYLGDDYKNLNQLEKNYSGLLTLSYVSISYIKNPNDNVETAEWLNFFKVINAGLTFKVFSIKRSAYRDLVDYDASEELKSLFQSTDRGIKKLLIKLLASNWIEYYQNFVQQKNRNYSTFFNDLSKIQVPIKKGLWGKLKNSYIENDDTRQLGEDLPFLDVELIALKHKPFLEALGVRHTITLDVALDRLKELASESNVLISQISKLYKFIEMKCPTKENKDWVNTHFRVNGFIYTGVNWLALNDVCWKTYPNSIIASSYPSLEKLYPESKTFFLSTLNVQESLSSSQLILILNGLSNRNEEDEVKTSAARIVYRHLDDELKKVDTWPDWVERFKEKPLLWTTKFKLQETRENIFINDAPNIASLFEDYENIAFLNIPFNQIQTFGDFLDLINIPYLSKVISKVLDPSASKKLLPEPTNKINHHSKLIERYFYTHHYDTFKKLCERGVFLKALTAKIFSVDKLNLNITLNDNTKSVKFDSNEINGDIYIDQSISNSTNYSMEIAKRLADWLGEPSATDFIEHILDNNDEKLKLRAIDLKDIPEKYIDQLAKINSIIQVDSEAATSNIAALISVEDPVSPEEILSSIDIEGRLTSGETEPPNQLNNISAPQEKIMQEGSLSSSPQGMKSSPSEGTSEIAYQPTPPKGRSSQGLSYANHEPSNSHSDGVEKQAKKLEIDTVAMNAVIEAEKAEGFEVGVFPHYNEGFDIHSKKGNELRIIEVKGTRGPWDDYGVSLSPPQMLEAKKSKENYWLYVVEYATTNPKIYKIQNPYEKITSFRFDRGWKEFHDSLSKKITQEPAEGMRIHFNTNEVGTIEHVTKYGELYTLHIKAEGQEGITVKLYDPSSMKIPELE